MEKAVRNGYPVIIEDVDETIDPALETILSKDYYEQDGRTLINFCNT